MDRILVTLTHPHAHAPEEARVRLERLMTAARERYPGYHLRHTWADGAYTRATFVFEKPGKGHGAGRAELTAGRVEVEIDAQFRLPFFVPVVVAEKIVRDELARSLRASFD